MVKISKGTIAYELAKGQRDISIAEFFSRNRHLLGFDNPKKALLTTIKEAVDNSLDACEEADILPEIEIQAIDMGDDRFKVVIEDNGPGIVKKQVPKIFAKLLYGSKFFKLSQSRGQQGIGISASVMYGQLTTGRPAKIISKISKNDPAHYYELVIDTKKNKPDIIKDEVVEWDKNRGTRVEIDLEATYRRGKRSVDAYLKYTAVVNPHATIIYTSPNAEQIIFPRVTDKLPEKPQEIKPHPHGVELGRLIKMLNITKCRTIQSFLKGEFSSVGAGTAKKICENAALRPSRTTSRLSREQAEKLLKGIKKTKIISPPTNCISPIGEKLLKKGLKKEINAEFYCTVTRSPSVYRGNPFLVEVGIAYGGDQRADSKATLMRYANRVPLLYQKGACSITKAARETNWRSYGLSQSSGSLPKAPATILVHIASVWVPFTSESKEAVAHYPEIIKEVTLALQEAGRKLKKYVKRKKKVKAEIKKRDFIKKYIPHIGGALKELNNLDEVKEREVEKLLEEILKQDRGKLKKLGILDNPEYDEEFAKIGRKKDASAKKDK
ncbi:MAG: Type 2 DNA topoisomerase 6 subunit B [Candidatus Woesearchaeota archaeon]|nr:Type 2 DNA topoisomerase 6 subunit B [Candidatus Woesearchaeota archaeon]